MASFIVNNFVPVKIHIKEQPAMWHRFGTRWTPTQMVLDPQGKEQWRIEGFLPADELEGQLELGLAFSAVGRKDWSEAERLFRDVVERFPKTAAAPEALYWTGVSKYSASHDAAALKELGRQFKERYTDTSWAKRASVW